MCKQQYKQQQVRSGKEAGTGKAAAGACPSVKFPTGREHLEKQRARGLSTQIIS